MKNINFAIITLVITILFFGCSKDDPKVDEVTYFTYNSFNQLSENYANRDKKIPLDNVNIDFYNTESDFLAKKNKVSSLKTDNFGKAKHSIETGKTLYLYAYKDSLNSTAGGLTTNRISGPDRKTRSLGDVSGDAISREVSIYLMTTPVKLQIKAFKSSQPLKNVPVKLFLSKEDRDNNKIYSSTEIYNESSVFKNTLLGGIFPDRYNERNTNSDGIATIAGISPLKYWITIDGKNTVPETIGKLADNADITNYFELSVP